jgi:hypothetical protein
MTACTRCGVDHAAQPGLSPELYDVDKARHELAAARKRRDGLTHSQSKIGDSLAAHVDRHFSAEELETAGRALLIAAGSLAGLADMDLPPQVMCNILGFAGDRLITDGQVTTL